LVQCSPCQLSPEEIEKVGLAGLPALADPEVSLDVAMKYATRRPVTAGAKKGGIHKQKL